MTQQHMKYINHSFVQNFDWKNMHVFVDFDNHKYFLWRLSIGGALTTSVFGDLSKASKTVLQDILEKRSPHMSENLQK